MINGIKGLASNGIAVNIVLIALMLYLLVQVPDSVARTSLRAVPIDVNTRSQHVEVQANTNFRLPITIKAHDQIEQLQFDFKLPAGIALLTEAKSLRKTKIKQGEVFTIKPMFEAEKGVEGIISITIISHDTPTLRLAEIFSIRIRSN